MSDDPHLAAGAYAAGALDDLEAAAFERHLRGCPTCAVQAREFAETTARLAAVVAVPPPPELKTRVLADIQRSVQLPPARDATRRGPRWAVRGAGRLLGGTGRLPRLLAAAAAAALIVLAAAGWWHSQAGQTQTAALQRIVAVTSDPQALRVAGQPRGGGTTTVIVSSHGVVVSAQGMARLDAAHRYQLWVIRPGHAASSLGLAPITGPPSGSATSTWVTLVNGVASGDTVAVSVEPAAGSPAPTTPPVVAVQV